MDNFLEEWIVIINKNKYYLDKTQAEVLKQAISQGKRGTVLFKNFSIAIPYIEEFFLNRKWMSDNHLLTQPEDTGLTPEQTERNSKRLAEIKQKLAAIVKNKDAHL